VPELRDDPLAAASAQRLAEGICRGSEAHFDALYERYFQRIFAFLYVRLHSRADAEELTQETFLAVFRGIGSYSARSSPLAWIYGIAKNVLAGHLRREHSRELRTLRAGPEAVQGSSPWWRSTPEEQLWLARATHRIEESLASLSAWQVEVFRLRHVENLPIGEIAARMDRSNDAIRSSLYRVKRVIVGASGIAAEGGAP